MIEVLREKHPELMIPDLEQEGWASFERYDEYKSTIPVDCTEEIVGVVAGKLGGGAGPGSGDAITIKSWLLRYGRASQILREELAAWTEWLCNESPPWAAYCAMMGARQLCAGLEAGIEGALHAVWNRSEEHETMEFGEWEVDDSIWEQMAEGGEIQDSLPMRREREARTNLASTREQQDEEEMAAVETAEATEQEILLLVDAANGFNMLSRLGMLWTVRVHAQSSVGLHLIATGMISGCIRVCQKSYNGYMKMGIYWTHS